MSDAAERARRKLAAWWARREPVPGGPSPWVTRQVRRNTAEIAALKARFADHEAEAAAARADIFDVMAQSAKAAGAHMPDLEQTMPLGKLHAVPDKRWAS